MMGAPVQTTPPVDRPLTNEYQGDCLENMTIDDSALGTRPALACRVDGGIRFSLSRKFHVSAPKVPEATAWYRWISPSKSFARPLEFNAVAHTGAFMTHRVASFVCLACPLLSGVAFAQVQTSPASAAAQSRYEASVAACNNSGLPDPRKEGCIRAAGTALDRSRGGPPPTELKEAPGGRAVVITPDAAPPPTSGLKSVETPDGRASVVLPADRPPARQ